MIKKLSKTFWIAQDLTDTSSVNELCPSDHSSGDKANTWDGTTDNGWSIEEMQVAPRAERVGVCQNGYTSDLLRIANDLKEEVGQMQRVVPHYLLFTEVFPARAENQGGQWRFTLQQVDGPDRTVVADWEPEFSEERLQLLSVVRGLEALDQPSRVTLITACRAVDQGIRIGLEQWRDDGWQWESFGEMTPVKNLDLWRRIDRAMRFHQLQCRYWKNSIAESMGLELQEAATEAAEPTINVATDDPEWSAFGRKVRSRRRLTASEETQESVRGRNGWGWASQAAASTCNAVKHLAKIGRDLSVNCAANL